MVELELEKVPSIGISYQVPLHDHRQLVLQSCIERDCDATALNTLLDKLYNAGERQFARGQIEDLQVQLDRTQLEAQAHRLRMEKADEQLKREWSNGRRKGDVQLTQSQLQKQQEAYIAAEQIKTRLEKLAKDKVDWEAKLATL